MSRERNEDFDKLKVALLLAHDFSGSEEEMEGIKEAIWDYNNNPNVSDRNKIAPEYLSFDKLYFSTNSKTGITTVNFNISSSFKCFDSIEGHCKVQNQIYEVIGSKLAKTDLMGCYACRDEVKSPKKLQYSFLNYVVFNTLSIEEILKQLNAYLDSHLEVDYLRFNENGCFYSFSAFEKCDLIASEINKRLLGTFSYTANKDLYKRYYNNCNMCLNLSNHQMEGAKTTKIINPNREAILKVLRSPDMVLCCGNCTNCSYCKDKNDLRTVVFVRHGMGITESIETLLTVREYKSFLQLVKLENAKFEATFEIECIF